MRAWILIGSLAAAVGAAACGAPVAQPLEANGAIATPVVAPERIVYQDAVYERVSPARRPSCAPKRRPRGRATWSSSARRSGRGRSARW